MASQPFDVLQAQMEKVQHPQWARRSSELALITELIFELTYDEYRLLVGTLNSMRDKYYRTWVDLIMILALFKTEISTMFCCQGLLIF